MCRWTCKHFTFCIYMAYDPLIPLAFLSLTADMVAKCSREENQERRWQSCSWLTSRDSNCAEFCVPADTDGERLWKKASLPGSHSSQWWDVWINSVSRFVRAVGFRESVQRLRRSFATIRYPWNFRNNKAKYRHVLQFNSLFMNNCRRKQ